MYIKLRIITFHKKLKICNIFNRFSFAMKCTFAGRVLMQLDFTQFISEINYICPINPLPNKKFVEVYIETYYLPESSLKAWIRDHQVKYNLVVLK